MRTHKIGRKRTVVQDGHMQYINGLYYVREDKAGRFFVCDFDGIREGEDLEHVGDDFATLEEAIKVCDKDANR
jgi:hypothetical protein